MLIVVPIYNPDGTDAFAPGERNRPGQNGPAIVGRRPNGMGLDLNRDYVKQEAPETRGAICTDTLANQIVKITPRAIENFFNGCIQRLAAARILP